MKVIDKLEFFYMVPFVL